MQYNHTNLIKIEGVEDQKDADFYLGKRVAYIYKVRRQAAATRVRGQGCSGGEWPVRGVQSGTFLLGRGGACGQLAALLLLLLLTPCCADAAAGQDPRH